MQKTAYEMRISDWSSDVCSSDLIGGGRVERPALHLDADLAVVRDDRRDVEEIVDVDSAVFHRTGDAADVGDGETLGIARIGADALPRQIGRASCRERVGKSVCIQVVADSYKKKYK